MKKTILLIILFVMGMSAECMAQTTYTDVPKSEMKRIQKDVKQKMKEYKKEGWKIYGSSQTLERALTDYYIKLYKLGDHAREQSGISTRCKSRNLGSQQSIVNAAIEYSEGCQMELKGKIVSEVRLPTSDEPEIERFCSGFGAQVQKEIQGEMERCYQLIREYPDGTCEIQSMFIIDPERASAARIRAMRNAMAEDEMMSVYQETMLNLVSE